VRGLKSADYLEHNLVRHVALLVSAWIEMTILSRQYQVTRVALLVSAWIEIALLAIVKYSFFVALLVSAWIEIFLQK